MEIITGCTDNELWINKKFSMRKDITPQLFQTKGGMDDVIL